MILSWHLLEAWSSIIFVQSRRVDVVDEQLNNVSQTTCTYRADVSNESRLIQAYAATQWQILES